MAISEFHLDVLRTACEINQNITIMVYQKGEPIVYRSRLLRLDPAAKEMIIDEPSPDTLGALPLSKGEAIEVFFEIKTFRYLFHSRITDHTMFQFQNKAFYALKIQIPTALGDGERREYFRVEVARNAMMPVHFNIYKHGSRQPVMSALMADTLEEFEGEIIDISGGGFSMRSRPGVDLEKGDTIGARFRLRSDLPEIELWCEVRNVRRIPGTEVPLWGIGYLREELNPFIRAIRSKILRFVLERQREILFK